MKFSFIKCDKDIDEAMESVSLALDGLHTYEFLDKEDCTKATGEYTLWMEGVYNVIGLRQACEYIVEVPGRDLYYPLVRLYRNSGEYSFINFGIQTDPPTESCVIFRTDFVREFPCKKNFETYALEIMGRTLYFCKIEVFNYIATSTRYHSWISQLSISDKLSLYEEVMNITEYNGRTWYLLCRLRETLKEIIKATIHDSTLELPSRIKRNILGYAISLGIL